MLMPFDYLMSKYQMRVDGILHLGANNGQEADAYAPFVQCVIWVEALPEVCQQLKARVAKYPLNVVYCACVSDRDGDEVVFHVANNEAQSSSLLEFGTHAQEHPNVLFTKDVPMQTKRVDSLLRDYPFEGNWFLNVDLQGAELLALSGMGDLLGLMKYAYIEVNDRELYRGCPRIADIDQYLAPFGFVGQEARMTTHGWGDKFYIRAPF